MKCSMCGKRMVKMDGKNGTIALMTPVHIKAVWYCNDCENDEEEYI